MIPNPIPTAKARRGKGPRTKKQVREKRMAYETPRPVAKSWDPPR